MFDGSREMTIMGVLFMALAVLWPVVGVVAFLDTVELRHTMRAGALRVRQYGRTVRGRMVLGYRLRVIKVRERWGYLRAAGVLARVCIPVAWSRYVPASFRVAVREGFEALMIENRASMERGMSLFNVRGQ